MPEAVDEALVHLILGIKLAPQDLTIHMGRLHILEVSGRYDEMVKALDESCTTYTGKDVPDAWLAYAPELMDLRQYSAGLDFMKVLDQHYPNNPDIIGNVGAFLLYLKKTEEAIPYLQKAVDLAPRDSLNAWDLGRAYDYSNQNALADKWYKRSLSLPHDKDQQSDTPCLYAEFVETKLNDRSRACTLEKQNCPAEKQTACANPAPTKTP
jgi:tetratricopeptide (TPR) repeat protein